MNPNSFLKAFVHMLLVMVLFFSFLYYVVVSPVIGWITGLLVNRNTQNQLWCFLLVSVTGASGEEVTWDPYQIRVLIEHVVDEVVSCSACISLGVMYILGGIVDCLCILCSVELVSAMICQRVQSLGSPAIAMNW